MAAKRAVQGRSKPYDELLLGWSCSNNPNFVEPEEQETAEERIAEKRLEEKERLQNSAATCPPQENRRRPNVTDALSYLDTVEAQFQDKPDFYNYFLDTLAEFKNKHIDTPGVIQRVSRLFHGNPTLIQGFNTFLPLGYRIDIPDLLDSNTITVTTPLGTMTQSNSAFNVQGDSSRLGYGAPSNLNPQTTVATSFLGDLNGDHVGRRPASEPDHAVQYLTKVKARYRDESNIYEQFLDILQTYQKDQRNFQDVYLQVQLLFKDAPELVAELRDFLPKSILAVSGQNGAVILPQHGGQTVEEKRLEDEAALANDPNTSILFFFLYFSCFSFIFFYDY